MFIHYPPQKEAQISSHDIISLTYKKFNWLLNENRYENKNVSQLRSLSYVIIKKGFKATKAKRNPKKISPKNNIFTCKYFSAFLDET